MRAVEITPSGVLGTLAVFVVVAVCVRLGFWQLDRREERAAANAAIAERLDEDPVVLEGVPADTTGLTHRRVTVRGRIDGDRTIVLAGRSFRGQPGAHLLAPLLVEGRALLVNRGWVPAPDAATVDLAAVPMEGEATVEGVLLPFPDVEVDRDDGRFRTTWYRLDGDAMAAQYPYPVAELYLLATTRPTGPAAPDTARQLPAILPPPELDPGPHLSYAVQWFSFAAIFLIGWISLLVRGGRGRESEPGPASTPPSG